MLCKLYSNWCKKNPLVVIADASKDTKYAGVDRAALFTQRGVGHFQRTTRRPTTRESSLKSIAPRI